MIGQTVAGEYTVKVNGSALAENAIVVDGKAHVHYVLCLTLWGLV